MGGAKFQADQKVYEENRDERKEEKSRGSSISSVRKLKDPEVNRMPSKALVTKRTVAK